MTVLARRPPSRGAASPVRGGADRRLAALTSMLAAGLPEAERPDLRVPAAARAAFLAARRTQVPSSAPLVVAVRNDEEAHRLADDLGAWLAAGRVRVLPERAALPLERALPEHDESAERLEVLAELGGRSRDLVVVAPLLALVQRTLASAQLQASRIELGVGEHVAQRELLTALVNGGDEPVVEVSGIGEFANRGGLIDLWPPGAGEPLRVELFGDVVESLRSFDPMTQGSRRRLDRTALLPASEFLPPEGFSRLREGMPGARPSRKSWQETSFTSSRGTSERPPRRGRRCSPPDPRWTTSRPGAHLVLTDASELATIAADLDRQATERRERLVASGELPQEWPLPYDAG